MIYVKAIVALCCAFVALLFIENIIAGIQAQSYGVASHQEAGNE